MNSGETWQEAGARELFEETAITVEPSELMLLDVQSVPEDDVLILFALAKPRARQEVNPTIDPQEVSEVVLVKEPVQLAFPTHTQQLATFFTRIQG